MSTAFDSSTESEIFSRIVGGSSAIPPAVAESVLEWKFSRRDKARVNVLQSKNNEGALNPDEQEELARYVRVGQMLAVLHARARLVLRSREET